MSITLPSIEAPPEPSVTLPSPAVSPPPPVGYGLPYDLTLTTVTKESVETTTVSTDAALTITPRESVETTLESTDGTLTLPSITYETQVS
jgi:hypothetical protein